VARFYVRHEHWAAARDARRGILRDYPNLGLDREALIIANARRVRTNEPDAPVPLRSAPRGLSRQQRGRRGQAAARDPERQGGSTEAEHARRDVKRWTNPATAAHAGKDTT